MTDTVWGVVFIIAMAAAICLSYYVNKPRGK